MNDNIRYLKNLYKENSDLIIRSIKNKGNKIYIVFFESLTDSSSVYEFAIKSIQKYLYKYKKFKTIKDLIDAPKINKVQYKSEIPYYLENGFFAVIYNKEIFVCEAKANIDRGVTSSNTEPNMYGPKDAFCENYQKNLGLIKRRVKNDAFKIENFDFGTNTKTKVSLCYVNGLVNKTTLEKVRKQIDKLILTDVLDSEDINKSLQKNKIFPTVMKTEKPFLAASYALKGYPIILVDNAPFALILDSKIKDFINPSTTDNFIKVLRYICLIFTILIPAIYIALINFNQETIPTSLLLNFMKQRSGVPFPAVIEAYIALLICEILRETDIRFPTNYGSAASILGALILGDAAVAAGLVSPIMIIIVAITFITSLIFTEIKLVWAIRILRFSLLTVASFLGLYGLGLAVICALGIICSVQTYEGDYI